MLHHRLQDVRRELVGVHRGECPAKVMEAVGVAGGRVLVLLGTVKVDSCLSLNSVEFQPKVTFAQRPRKTNGEKPRIGRRCSIATGWSDARASPFPLLSQ